MNETAKAVQIDVVIRGTEITGPPRKYYVGTEIERFNRNGAPTKPVSWGRGGAAKRGESHTTCVMNVSIAGDDEGL